MGKIFLKYEKNKYLELKFRGLLNDVWLRCQVDFALFWGQQCYKLFSYDTAVFLEEMLYFFRDLLLHKEKMEWLAAGKVDIGYLYNQLLVDEVPYKVKGKIWHGYDYLVWEGSSNEQRVAIWLYNNSNGEITLHITEKYGDKLKDKGISYKQFMKNYKPILTEVIPHQVIRKWLAQCEYLYWQLQENERLWDIEHARLEAAGECQECLDEKTV